MTAYEVFTEITSKQKWYAGVVSCQSASRIMRMHKLGLYHNYKWLFNKFGYVIENDISWKKEDLKLLFPSHKPLAPNANFKFDENGDLLNDLVDLNKIQNETKNK